MPDTHFNSFFSRQMRLEGIGIEGMQKLQDAKVLVIGAGGLGCPVIMNLFSAGIGAIGIADADKVEAHNLHRQQLYTMADVGKKKVDALKEKLPLSYPFSNFVFFEERVAESNILPLISNYDIIIDCTDNFPTRYLINDACVMADKPWVFASIEGWEGQLTVCNTIVDDTANNGCHGELAEPFYSALRQPFGKLRVTEGDNDAYSSTMAKSPTYRCIFPEPPLDIDAPNCEETGVLNTFTNTLGSMQAHEAIKIVLGMKSNLAGKLLILNFATTEFNTIAFERQEEEVKKIRNSSFPEASGFRMTTNSPVMLRHSLPRHFGEAAPNNTELEIEIPLPTDTTHYRLIDIREAYEFEESPTEAENIPYHELLAKAPELTGNILLMCDTGKRSLILAKHLREVLNSDKIFSLKRD
ncbi:MAG: HesA/MoeB/ThiF family protein [Bacteroidetes bacterium]|nr:HesA/MoeB/ThiF family protein [Bacteroidota bacterium]